EPLRLGRSERHLAAPGRLPRLARVEVVAEEDAERALAGAPAQERATEQLDRRRAALELVSFAAQRAEPPLRDAARQAHRPDGARASLRGRRAAELSHVRQQPGERGVPWRQLPSCPPCRGAVARATAAGRARHAVATAPS